MGESKMRRTKYRNLNEKNLGRYGTLRELEGQSQSQKGNRESKNEKEVHPKSNLERREILLWQSNSKERPCRIRLRNGARAR